MDGIAWDTISWARRDNRNAGQKDAGGDKDDDIFFSDIHSLWTIMSAVFRDFFKTLNFAQTLYQASCDTQD